MPYPLLGHVDGVIIAASANATRRQDARRLTEQLRSFDARILGVVVNGGSAVSGYGYVPSRPPSAPLVDDRLDVPGRFAAADGSARRGLTEGVSAGSTRARRFAR